MSKAASLKPYKREIEEWTTEEYFKPLNRDAKGKELHAIISTKLKNKYARLVSLSYIQEILARLNGKRKKGDLEDPEGINWSIGICKEKNYNISNDVIPLLIKYKESIKEPKSTPDLTVRQVIWMSILWPTIKQTVEPDRQYKCLMALGKLYAYKEWISVVVGNLHFDTTELDRYYFIEEKLSEECLHDAIMEYSIPEKYRRKYANQADYFEGFAPQDFENTGVSLNKKQLALVSEYTKNVLRGAVILREWTQANRLELIKLQKYIKKTQKKENKAGEVK